MWIKTNELIGKALAWAVAKCEGFYITIKPNEIVYVHPNGEWYSNGNWAPTDKWSQGGPIIEREDISVIRLDNKSVPNDRGYWQGVYENNWGAVIKTHHVSNTVYGPQGDDWGQCYSIDALDIVEGRTPLIAAMRCYVASKLGDEVEVPDELV